MWFRVNDKFHSNTKVRKVRRTHASKRRDASAIGVWVQAATWSADNKADGFCPEEVVETFDDEWESIVERLMAVLGPSGHGLFEPAEVNGEPGWIVHDFLGFNDSREKQEKDALANRMRVDLMRDTKLVAAIKRRPRPLPLLRMPGPLGRPARADGRDVRPREAHREGWAEHPHERRHRLPVLQQPEEAPHAPRGRDEASRAGVDGRPVGAGGTGSGWVNDRVGSGRVGGFATDSVDQSESPSVDRSDKRSPRKGISRQNGQCGSVLPLTCQRR